MKQYNNEKYIVSMTSFPQRYNLCVRAIFNLLQNQTYKNFHLVLTLYKDDYAQITDELKIIIDSDLIEVIIAEENLCPHLKYFYAMKKYWDKPIITLDDDRNYSNNIIEVLVKKYETLNYKSIVCNVAPKMSQTNGKLDDSIKWCIGASRLSPNEKSYVAMAEGFGGVLYPPKAFDSSTIKLEEIKDSLYHDDIYLKVLAIRNKLIVTQSNSRWDSTVFGKDMDGAEETSLYNHCHRSNFDYRRNVTKSFETDLIKGFYL